MLLADVRQPPPHISLLGPKHSLDTRDHALNDALLPRVWVKDYTSFHCTSTRRDVADVTVSLVNLGPFRLRGRGNYVTGYTHVSFVLNGSVRAGSPEGPAVTHGPGTIFAVRQWVDADIDSIDRLRILDIRLPDARLRDRGVRVNSGPIKLDATETTGVPLRLFALAVLESAWRPPSHSAEIDMVARVIEDLVVALFVNTPGYARDSGELRECLRARASTYIASEYHHSALNPTRVATHLGVSLRHLQRAFEGSGTTVARVILTRRTESAAMLLKSLSTDRITMAEVAGRSGFSSTYELRAAIKARYGALPSRFRGDPSAVASIASRDIEIRDAVTPPVTEYAHAGA